MSLIRPKFSAPSQLAITLANLGSSTTGVGRQSDLVNNSVTRYDQIYLYGRFTTGTNPTAEKTIAVYLIRGDGTRRSDNAGASDAAITRWTASLLKLIPTDATSNKPYSWDAVIVDPGPEWGLAIVHETVAALKNVAGDQSIYWVGSNVEGS